VRSMPATKYKPYEPLCLPDRTWPDRALCKAPRWCSVDLRDGNQALMEPMGPEQKFRFFQALVELGFREIEVAFPAASVPERQFMRDLIERDAIPDDVTIQVLTPARAELIEETFAAIQGVKSAIVHLHNPTSELQRRVVFEMSREQIIELAVEGARSMQACRARYPETRFGFEYSPESFTGTEPEFALEITLAVFDVWQPTASDPMIVNLPATVEMSLPNVYADRIEWFARELEARGVRDRIVLSVHPHNDRGTAVAAAELALLAGADRVEGTLLGNGERTGNVDLVTLALNLYSQGVDPELAFWDLDAVVRLVEESTQIRVHPRHPYAGSLVYTSFSGSHQDAIRKGLAALERARSDLWEVPYLPIDPADVGRSYEGIIRINSQSGKGGVAFLVERELGIRIPRGLAVEFSRRIQERVEASGSELPAVEVAAAFEREYLGPLEHARLLKMSQETAAPSLGNEASGNEASGNAARPANEASPAAAEPWGEFRFVLEWGGERLELCESATGPIAAFVQALSRSFGVAIEVLDYAEHSLAQGAPAAAIAFVQIGVAGELRHYGVGRATDIVRASLEAILAGLERSKFGASGARRMT